MNNLRKTGRTTRMIEEARRLQQQGKQVIIMVENLAAASAMRAQLPGQGMNSIRVESIGQHPNFNWSRMEIPGMGEQWVVLVDHWVIEQKFGNMVDMLHRFDPAIVPEMGEPEEPTIHEENLKAAGFRKEPENQGSVNFRREPLESDPDEEPFIGSGGKAPSEQKCQLPPEGWICSRPAGHEGPCAASPAATGGVVKLPPRLVGETTNELVSTDHPGHPANVDHFKKPKTFPLKRKKAK